MVLYGYLKYRIYSPQKTIKVNIYPLFIRVSPKSFASEIFVFYKVKNVKPLKQKHPSTVVHDGCISNLYKKILEFNFYFIYHAHFDIFVKSFVFCNAILQLFQIVSG